MKDNGYTVKYSLNSITDFVDNPTSQNLSYVQGALNDLEVIFKNGNVNKQKYEFLKANLQERLNNHK